MLGTVAKKLRILGFDCSYLSAIDDNELVAVAQREGRTIITRDQAVVQRCKKRSIAVIGVSAHSERDQLAEIARGIGLREYRFDPSDARCPVCNGALETAPESALITVPPRVLSSTREFWRCIGCGHVYWEGTHIRNIRKLIGEVNAGLQHIG